MASDLNETVSKSQQIFGKNYGIIGACPQRNGRDIVVIGCVDKRLGVNDVA